MNFFFQETTESLSDFYLELSKAPFSLEVKFAFRLALHTIRILSRMTVRLEAMHNSLKKLEKKP